MWQIEETKERRSVCRDCNRSIERGAHRFGSYDLDRWYHLECAAARSSRAFAPFAQEAAALLNRAPAPAPPPPEPVRNPELEARLLAQPEDDAIRGVFADWLQSIDDPWGELIALELAGKDARSVLKAHFDSLIGDLPPRMFEWRRGFIHTATFDSVSLTDLRDTLEAVFALRTTMLLHALHVPLLVHGDAMTVINDQAPPTLRHISAPFTSSLRFLALPELEQLAIAVSPYPDADGLEPFFAARQLPKLARLQISGRTLPVTTLGRFLESDLVRQLCWLEIADGVLDRAGEALIARQRGLLAHIPVMKLSLALDDVFPEQRAAWFARAAD